MLLKKGVEEGLTLFDLGSMLQRPDFGDSKSLFERTVDRTLNIVGAQDGEAGAEDASPKGGTGKAGTPPGV
jgi:hypothetical protein